MWVILLGLWVRTVKQHETNTQVWAQDLFLKQRRVFYCVIDYAKISLK